MMPFTSKKVSEAYPMKCFFVSDLHGYQTRYTKVFQKITENKPDCVFFGGDLLPHHNPKSSSMESYLDQIFFQPLRKIHSTLSNPPEIFVILGNDDPRQYETLFLNAEKEGNLHYCHNKTIPIENFFVSGLSFVPPTPFQLKDWERYDVSRHIDVGAISPELGIHTVEISDDELRFDTIEKNLENLVKNAPPEKTIFLFHCPPYKSQLDRAALDGQMVDHAPLDLHIGSIAIQRFIKIYQPFITLHGHVHESSRLTGQWMQKFGKTVSFSAAYDGPELSLVQFELAQLENCFRELI